MWDASGCGGNLARTEGGMMCCLFFVFFCWVGKLLCCCFFWIMMKSNKKPVKEKRAVGIQKKLMAQGGWNFKLQRKLAIVEVQDHFVQSFSKEMVGRKLFVTYSPNCQQFPVQGRSFFWCCRRLFTDASMSVSLGSRCVWTRIIKYFSLVWVRTLSATSIRVHEVLFLSLTYKIFGKIGSKYICRREVSGRLIGVLIGAI